MSRCFPFPPPGYEKKPTTDDLDLLKKEKRKEKKHKKDKKDKEKKEGKEKREKDRSESKHKDKKDKKEKHRDKKDKKDKGKTSNSSTQDEGYNGENPKLPHHNIHNNEQIIQEKKQQILQIRNGESNKDRTTSSTSSQPSTQSQGQNGDLARNNRDTENYKFVQELDRRIRDEEKGTGSHQFIVEGRKNSFNNKFEMQNSISMARSKINGATPPRIPPPLPPLQTPQPPLVDRRFDQKEKVQESDDKRGDKRKHKDRDKRKEKDGEKEKKEERLKEKSERDKSKHVKKTDLSSMGNLDHLSVNHLGSSFQGVIGSEGILKKRKDSETNGVFHENEPRPNKMARQIPNIPPENGRKLDFLQNPSSSFLDNQRASQGQLQNNLKVGSSKSQKVNGLISSPPPPLPLPPKKPLNPTFNHIHHKPSPIKSPPPPLPPPVITNHVTAKSPPLTTTKPPPPPPTIPNPIPSLPLPVKQPLPRPKPPPAVVKAAAPPPPKKKPDYVKPPHPDTKYLKEILSVPKLDEWGGVDEQEWLFNKAGAAAPPPPPPEKAAVQVWSEAKHIESVDVCALPYVIPY